MAEELHQIEPWYGWLDYYNSEQDERSPFYSEEHSLFKYDRSINSIPAHPLWEHFGSESLLLKVLFAEYDRGFAVIELFGEWNDLYDNDFKLLTDHCLYPFMAQGIKRFIFICENVFHSYLDRDDYYQALIEDLEDGYLCLLHPRPDILQEMEQTGIANYFYRSDVLDNMPWRKLRPEQLFKLVDARMALRLMSFK